MTTHLDKQRPSNGQLIFVPHKDTIRLLEVYVKRSLSLNDGTLGKVPSRKEKWVTIRQRRHSSDPSLHLSDGDIGTFAPSESPDRALEKTIKKPKKPKKPSLWKSFLGFFSRREDEEQEGSPETPAVAPAATPAPTNTTTTTTTTTTFEDTDSDTAISCLPPDATQRKKTTKRKSLRRRFSTKRLSVIRPGKRETNREHLNVADITGVEAVVSVEPTYAYYEKVSEELEKILHEVKEKEEVETLTDEEVINRIIELTKEEGDAIHGKITNNPTLSGFFQRMTYSSFQRLADAYLEKEATPTNSPPTVLPTAPELVKLAFTLDFTARVAGLSRQNIGHITGLGNRYLQDRFEYKQACTETPWSDSDD